jgi:aminoglycoside phosphotransferase (APT) family kinase protein
LPSDVSATGREPDGVGLLAHALGVELVPLPHGGRFHNQHFRAVPGAGGPPRFVKILDDVGYWSRAVASATLVERLPVRTPRLLDYGTLDDGTWWLMYEWMDLTEFTPTPDHLAEAGAMIGNVHRTTTALSLHPEFQHHDLVEEIEQRATNLARMDTAAADQVLDLLVRFRSLAPDPRTCVLINGDVQWQNFGLDHNGAVVWFDWENTGCGHPMIDLGKLVDLGLADPSGRDAFVRGYREGVDEAVLWPPRELPLIRLWAAVGTLVYALARGLPDLARHGHTILTSVERSGTS